MCVQSTQLTALLFQRSDHGSGSERGAEHADAPVDTCEDHGEGLPRLKGSAGKQQGVAQRRQGKGDVSWTWSSLDPQRFGLPSAKTAILDRRYWKSELMRLHSIFVKVGPELRCVQKYKTFRDKHLDVLLLDDEAILEHHRNQTRLNTGEQIVARIEFLVTDEHKMTVRLSGTRPNATAEGPHCYIFREFPRSTTQDTNATELTTQLNLLVTTRVDSNWPEERPRQSKKQIARSSFLAALMGRRSSSIKSR